MVAFAPETSRDFGWDYSRTSSGYFVLEWRSVRKSAKDGK